MTDQLTDRERLALDVWEPMAPPAGFADRVLDSRGRRWLPYAVTAVSCCAAAAIIAAILSRPGAAPARDAAEVAVGPIETDDANPVIIADAHEIDAAITGLAPDGGISYLDAGGYWIDGGFVPSLPDETKYDVNIEAGETFTVHTPTDGAIVKFQDLSCGGPIGAEVDRDPAFKAPTHSGLGITGAVIFVETGSWYYRVICNNGAPVVRGRLTVIRDAATRKLPTNPPINTVEADGRTWRISYQSQLGSIAFKRPAGGEQLHLRRSDGTEVSTWSGDLRLPSVFVDASLLPDGTYTYWFERGGVTVGKVSTLAIGIDQTSPQIVIESPVLDARAKPPIDVRGTATPGWTISIEGIAVPVDPQHRFIASIVPPNQVITIRAVHPVRGIHYYLRRIQVLAP